MKHTETKIDETRGNLWFTESGKDKIGMLNP
jgi:streptogramin lyase